MTHEAIQRDEMALRTAGIGLLIQTKIRSLRNHLLQTLACARFKLIFALGAVLLIWIGLFILFFTIFKVVSADTSQGIVAIPLMLELFFVALMVMLIFSNGIIAYATLFARDEPAYLLSLPIAPSSVVMLKYLESMILSSWSLVLIGVPLMAALAWATPQLPLYYHILFIAYCVCFVPIPCAIGVFLAWAVGAWLSRIAKRFTAFAVIILLSGLSWWFWEVWSFHQTDTKMWLEDFFERSSLVQGAFWPSTWVSRGLQYAREDELSSSLFYLYLTFSTALFSGWLMIRIVGRRFSLAYDRVQAAGATTRYSGSVTRKLATVLFWYLPDNDRELALKDLRGFCRDPRQWSQLLILLGLLGLYVVNVPNISFLRIEAFDFKLFISFLNLAAVSLILATFTSRFVFPLASLELQQLWLIALLPIPRSRILISKFVFALTITFLTGCVVIVLATLASQGSTDLLLINLIINASVCVGLCGMAVGLGARLPMLKETNPAKIANGLGGTVNLVASVALVAAVLGLCFLIGYRFRQLGGPEIDTTTLLLTGAIVGLGILAAAVPMWIGTRHFARLQH